MAKELGDYAELQFMLRAYEKGFSVLSPFSAVRKYDFALERQGRFIRVQVKSCSSPLTEKGAFYITASHGFKTKKPYTPEHCDVIACYIKSLNMFYLIPISALHAMKLTLYPLKDDSRYVEFKENWNI